MIKLLVVEGSIIVRGVFKELLDKNTNFKYDIVATYSEAQELLKNKTYDIGVVERNLQDASKGEIIALLNKYAIAPLVFAKEVDEIFFESFESAQIVDYILKQKYNNITQVVEKLKQLQENINTSILIASSSHTYLNYLENNLKLHNFNLLNATNNQEVFSKIESLADISLLVIDSEEESLCSKELIENIRRIRAKKELKILLLVRKSNMYRTSLLLSSGADDYLIKQFSREEFYVRVYQNIKIIA